MAILTLALSPRPKAARDPHFEGLSYGVLSYNPQMTLRPLVTLRIINSVPVALALARPLRQLTRVGITLVTESCPITLRIWTVVLRVGITLAITLALISGLTPCHCNPNPNPIVDPTPNPNPKVPHRGRG